MATIVKKYAHGLKSQDVIIYGNSVDDMCVYTIDHVASTADGWLALTCKQAGTPHKRTIDVYPLTVIETLELK